MKFTNTKMSTIEDKAHKIILITTDTCGLSLPLPRHPRQEWKIAWKF